jgi:tetratricopeptide (TPR) repeat protein
LELMGPTNEVRSQLIGAYLGLGRVDSAMIYVTEGVGPDAEVEYLFRTGTAYQRNREWDKALAVFDEGVRKFPEAPRMLRERGSCHAMLGDTVKARIDLDGAIAMAPHEAVNYNSRGVYLHAMYGDHARAVEDMDRAIKQDPNYGYAFSNRGWSEFKLGMVDKARKDLQLAIRKNPGNAYAYRNLGILELESGDKAKGCAYLHDALKNGFTASYGTEVEDLERTHCTGTEAAPMPDTPAPGGTPPPSNAPGGKPPRKGNAP